VASNPRPRDREFDALPLFTSPNRHVGQVYAVSGRTPGNVGISSLDGTTTRNTATVCSLCMAAAMATRTSSRRKKNVFSSVRSTVRFFIILITLYDIIIILYDTFFEYLYDLSQCNLYFNVLNKNTYLDCILKFLNFDNNFVEYFQYKYRRIAC